MGRKVLLEKETCETALNNYQAINVTTEKFGLLIGKWGDGQTQKDHVVYIAPTPEDDESDEGKDSAKVSWVTAHAKQIIRMLPGGLDIIGIIVACPASNFDQMKPEIQKILVQIEKITQRSVLGLKSSISDEYLIIHVCTKTKKVYCKSIILADKCASFRLAEYKIQQFIQNWSRLHTMCNLEMPYLTKLAEEKQQSYLKIQNALKSLAISISHATATINGEITIASCNILSLLEPQSTGKGKKSTVSSASGDLGVDLYLSPSTFSDTTTVDNQTTYVMYSGCVQGVAFIPSKTTVEDALQSLKYDIIRSIVGRFRILYEDVLETSDEPLIGCLLPPKRAVINTTNSTTFVDYIFESETEEDVASRLEEILDMHKDNQEIISSETFPDAETLEIFSIPRSRPVVQSVVAEITSGSSRVKVATGIIVASIAAIVSIIISKMVME